MQSEEAGGQLFKNGTDFSDPQQVLHKVFS